MRSIWDVSNNWKRRYDEYILLYSCVLQVIHSVWIKTAIRDEGYAFSTHVEKTLKCSQNIKLCL